MGNAKVNQFSVTTTSWYLYMYFYLHLYIFFLCLSVYLYMCFYLRLYLSIWRSSNGQWLCQSEPILCDDHIPVFAHVFLSAFVYIFLYFYVYFYFYLYLYLSICGSSNGQWLAKVNQFSVTTSACQKTSRQVV